VVMQLVEKLCFKPKGR